MSFFYECLITKSIYSLDTLLLCNKTSEGPGFKKTEIQALSTKTIRLGSGECDEFKSEGFSCIEHYQCAGDNNMLMTDGESQTRLEISRLLFILTFQLFIDLFQHSLHPFKPHFKTFPVMCIRSMWLMPTCFKTSLGLKIHLPNTWDTYPRMVL